MTATAKQTPSIPMVAHKFAERANRAAAILDTWEAEATAHMPQAQRTLHSFRWHPHQSERDVQIARIWYKGTRDSLYRIDVSCVQTDSKGTWEAIASTCDCDDQWGKHWLGSCKHQLAARVLVSRYLAKYGGPCAARTLPAAIVALPGADAILSRKEPARETA